MEIQEKLPLGLERLEKYAGDIFSSESGLEGLGCIRRRLYLYHFLTAKRGVSMLSGMDPPFFEKDVIGENSFFNFFTAVVFQRSDAAKLCFLSLSIPEANKMRETVFSAQEFIGRRRNACRNKGNRGMEGPDPHPQTAACTSSRNQISRMERSRLDEIWFPYIFSAREAKNSECNAFAEQEKMQKPQSDVFSTQQTAEAKRSLSISD